MTKSSCIILVAACMGSGIAQQDADPINPLARLQWFLGDEEQNKSLLPIIDRLESAKFAEREEAANKLQKLPALPPFIRTLAGTDERPEVRSRLRQIAGLHPVAKETDNLNEILNQIARDNFKGTLEILAQILNKNLWSPDATAVENAARATATGTDLPVLSIAAGSESIIIRRLAAAAYGGLPPEQSTAPLRKMLDDAAPSVALLAAGELSRRNDPDCLPTFARMLDAPGFHTRHQAWSALKGLSGKTFGYDPSANKPSRNTAALRWREWSLGPDASITGKLPESSAIVLFNGRDLTGWEVFENGRAAPDSDSWEVHDDLLVSMGRGRGDIRTTTRFDNYVLSLDYRTEDKRGDGGIGVMLTKKNEFQNGKIRPGGGSYLEVQLLPGRTGDIYVIGAFQAQAKGKRINFSNRRTAEAADPAAQWNSMKLTVRNGTVEVEVNGTQVNRVTGGSKGPGKIVLRNEAKKISYRNLLLLPAGP